MFPGGSDSASFLPRTEEHKWSFWEQMCCAVCCPNKTGWLADFLSWFCWCCDRTERVMRDRLPIDFRMALIERFGSAIKAVPEKHSLFHALAHASLQGRYKVRVDDTCYAGGQEGELAQALIAQFSSPAKDKTASQEEAFPGQSDILRFCKAHGINVAVLCRDPRGSIQESLLPSGASYRRTLYLITDGKGYFAPFEYGCSTTGQALPLEVSVMMEMGFTRQRNLQNICFLDWITHETGLHYRDVDTDGNCQFRAVAQQLGQITDAGLLGEGLPTLSEDDHAAVLREQAVKWLRDNRAHERVAPVLAGDSDYLENMAKDKCWGDELTAFALSQHLGMCIVTLTPDMQLIQRHYCIIPIYQKG